MDWMSNFSTAKIKKIEPMFLLVFFCVKVHTQLSIWAILDPKLKDLFFSAQNL